ncbi:MAG: ROK family transcriptional regulator [Oscillospiraceae bacterium]|nr:ROK family transcriptional regulator [Oscillospiraceae bacterium]
MPKQITIDQIAVPADIKLVNRMKILEHLLSGEKCTAQDIRATTGISKPTIMRTLQYFCNEGLVESAGFGPSSKVGGKKPEYFAFSDKRKILCIALWPTSVTFALSNLVGDVYALEEHPHIAEERLEDVFASLERFALPYLERQGVALSDLYGVGVSTSGIVDYKANLLFYNAKAPSWGRNIYIEEYLRPIFGEAPQYILENAGKACGRAILLDAPVLTKRRVLSLFCTWGLSACLIENGHVLSGKDSLIGEIGHMIVENPAPGKCICGKSGCLEHSVSLARIADMLGPDSPLVNGDSPLTFQTLFEASAAEDLAARKVVAHLASRFAVALHNLALVYNPDVVIFQGDFALADSYFDDCLKRDLAQFRYFPEEGVFEMHYDKRDLSWLAARGNAAMLRKHYFTSLQFD